jgi:hypothetical protein
MEMRIQFLQHEEDLRRRSITILYSRKWRECVYSQRSQSGNGKNQKNTQTLHVKICSRVVFNLDAPGAQDENSNQDAIFWRIKNYFLADALSRESRGCLPLFLALPGTAKGRAVGAEVLSQQ